MTDKDKIAQAIAAAFEQCDNSEPMFELAHFAADKGQMDMVICIDSMGVNRSKAFPVAEYPDIDVVSYFDKGCPTASDCQFKFYVWAA